MRSSWITVALLLSSAPALAQDLPLPIPPFVVPLPVPGTLPLPVPGALPLPVPGALPLPVLVPGPPPALPPPPPPPPVGWLSPEAPPPEPPAPKKVRGVVLAIDFGAALPIRSPDTKTAGLGGDFRVGYRFAFGPVWVAPEATVGLVGFPQYDGAIRGGIGGHLGLDAGVVEPSVYVFGGGFANIWKQGPGVRTGASLDFRPGRFVIPGVHVDYDVAEWNTGSLRYVGAGVHLGFLVGR